MRVYIFIFLVCTSIKREYFINIAANIEGKMLNFVRLHHNNLEQNLMTQIYFWKGRGGYRPPESCDFRRSNMPKLKAKVSHITVNK